MSLLLNIHDVVILIESPASGILENLRRDFEYFATGSPAITSAASAETPIRFTLLPEPPPAAISSPGRMSLWTREYRVYDKGTTRRIRYRDGASAIYDYAADQGTIYCADPMRLHELAYLAILSRAGERLDHRGAHRIHALGFEYEGDGGLLLLPSGGGKSSLALAMLSEPGFGILSDDTPLLFPGLRLHAFPIRWAFLPSADLSMVPSELVRLFHRKRHGLKRLVDVAYFRDRIRTDLPMRWLLIGQNRPLGAPEIGSISLPGAAAALFLNLVVGYGVAQLSEYMARPTIPGVLNLAGIAVSRLGAAARLLRQTETHRFILGREPRANLEVLSCFLKAATEPHPSTATPAPSLQEIAGGRSTGTT